MIEPAAAQRIRAYLNARTAFVTPNTSVTIDRAGDDAMPSIAGGWPLQLEDVAEIIGRLDQIRVWASTTEHGAAAAEILQLLNQPKGNR